jgi:hypothetical protein
MVVGEELERAQEHLCKIQAFSIFKHNQKQFFLHIFCIVWMSVSVLHIVNACCSCAFAGFF